MAGNALKPNVTVIIPTKTFPGSLDASIEMAVKQSDAPFEVILFDLHGSERARYAADEPHCGRTYVRLQPKPVNTATATTRT